MWSPPSRSGPSRPGIAAGNSIWVANAGSDTVSRISEAEPDAAPQTIRVGDRPMAIAAGVEGIFVSNVGDGTVQRIDANLNQPLNEIEVEPDAESIAVGHGLLWVASRSTDASRRSTR